jgi:hypothetical protein
VCVCGGCVCAAVLSHLFVISHRRCDDFSDGSGRHCVNNAKRSCLFVPLPAAHEHAKALLMI